MNSKAITSIIAIILILLITISMIGFVFMWFQRTGTDITITIENQTSELTEQVGQQILIDAISGNKIYLRNTGTGVIDNDSIAIYVDDKPVNFILSDIPEGHVGEATILGCGLGKHKLKVTTGAGTEVASRVKSEIVGSALRFDSVNDYVNLTASSSLRVETSSLGFTLESRIKPYSNIVTGSRFTVLAYYTPGWLMDLIDDGGTEGYRFYNGSNAYTYNPAGNSISLSWTHFLVSWNKTASNLTIYLDGLPKQSWTVSSVGTSTNPLFLGKRTDGLYFNGTIDDVRIYNRSLSADEVKHNFENPFNPITDGLVSWWSFDEGSGCVAFDKIGTNHGNLKPDCSIGPVWVFE